MNWAKPSARARQEEITKAAEKNLLWGFVVDGLLGAGAGFVFCIFFYPYIFLVDIVATETIKNREQKQLVADGNFIHANPSDPIHLGKGVVTVFRYTVYFRANFEVGPGPKYKVYLMSAADIKESFDA